MNLLIMMGRVLRHPYDFYEELQAPGKARWTHAVWLLLLAYAARMLSLMSTGYAFETREPHEISFVFEGLWLLVPWLTGTAANWAVSTILDGEGKFREIAVGSAYALVPYILFAVPVTLLTQMLSLDESSTYALFRNAVYAWVIWLLIVMIRTLHDFEPGKVVGICILTLIGVFIIWFVAIIFYGLIDRFIGFVTELVKEIQFRL
jgi:hypothetical protein